MLRMTRDLAKTYGIPNLCLAGGVALNCVANGKILRDGAFKRIWVQPAAGDAGGALGAAYAAHRDARQASRAHLERRDGRHEGLLSRPGVRAGRHRAAARDGRRALQVATTTPTLLERTVDALEAGHAVGWFQGRMEFGPRALGARSILGDPRNPEMQKKLNLKIKYRESFRPFAPSVLAEDVARLLRARRGEPLHADGRRRAARTAARTMTAEQEALFGIDKLNVPRSDMPAVTHVDYSARIQTVHKETNPRYHALISAFKSAHRLPGAGQHQLQRARRADRAARPRTRSAASWAARWRRSSSATACSTRRDQDPALADRLQGQVRAGLNGWDRQIAEWGSRREHGAEYSPAR